MELMSDTASDLYPFLKNRQIQTPKPNLYIHYLLMRYDMHVASWDMLPAIKMIINQELLSYDEAVDKVLSNDTTISWLKRLKKEASHDKRDGLERRIIEHEQEVIDRVKIRYDQPLDLSFKTCTLQVRDLLIDGTLTVDQLTNINLSARSLIMHTDSINECSIKANKVMQLSCFVVYIIVYGYLLAKDILDNGIKEFNYSGRSYDEEDYLDYVLESYHNTLPDGVRYCKMMP